jgi:hypothetical protein
VTESYSKSEIVRTTTSRSILVILQLFSF